MLDRLRKQKSKLKLLFSPNDYLVWMHLPETPLWKPCPQTVSNSTLPLGGLRLVCHWGGLTANEEDRQASHSGAFLYLYFLHDSLYLDTDMVYTSSKLNIPKSWILLPVKQDALTRHSINVEVKVTHHGHRYQVPHRAGPSIKPVEKPSGNSGVEGPPEKAVIIMIN